ncbi:non-homologous end-joining DNA ligase [Salinimicrobium sediminilitoris]|uniref:non-homologous end-joining DNA ligase n=1 Tax=Salinimicrobium sediminilitoris TaxID=2876715 RepID=UPI001E4FFA92|nr:non-homologous end-joining DNA ligase [Salinimicrobium sediminilitoris]MCC8358410.1 non-homologous end-joining DNA ligase [Salinimicrobium sediminilitoris]
MQIAGVEISHPEKVLFPEKEITKGDMISYYERIAPLMLPFLKDRPLTLHRFPGGITESGFYQKNASDYFPSFIKTIKIETEEGTNTQVLCNDRKSLVYLANQGTVAFHIWLSKKDKLRQPDRVVFDLDPSDDDFEKIKEGAKIMRFLLKSKEIDPSLMTSGKSGLHLYYNIRRGKDFDKVKALTRDIAEEAEKKEPGLFTTQLRKDKREGKIFVDYLRNSYAQTAVCPYSLRATEEAGVATPIEWEELSRIKSASQYHIENIFRRTAQLNRNNEE